MSSPPKDWDGAAYQQLSDPQFRWGLRVLDSIELRGDECALDLGCGPGRLTAELLTRLPRGRVIAVDASPSMILTARRELDHFGERLSFLQGDLLTLELYSLADLAFSTAVFHWVLDHERLFRVIHRALKPGGRLVAQCGGGRWQVSTNGGDNATWRRDGKELFYWRNDQMLTAVEVKPQGSEFQVGAAKPLFRLSSPALGMPYDVSPDGQRFLVNYLPEDTSTPLTLVVNWTAEVKK